MASWQRFTPNCMTNSHANSNINYWLYVDDLFGRGSQSRFETLELWGSLRWANLRLRVSMRGLVNALVCKMFRCTDCNEIAISVSLKFNWMRNYRHIICRELAGGLAGFRCSSLGEFTLLFNWLRMQLCQSYAEKRPQYRDPENYPVDKSRGLGNYLSRHRLICNH